MTSSISTERPSMSINEQPQFRFEQFEPASLHGWPAQKVFINGVLCGAITKTADWTIGYNFHFEEWRVSFDAPHFQTWMTQLPNQLFALQLFNAPQC